MKSKAFGWISVLAGLLLLAAGLYCLKTSGGLQGPGPIIPYVCVGVGCGLFGQGLSALITQLALGRDPALQKKLEIEEKDERNRAIADRSKGKAFDSMTFVFGALMFSLALMRVDTAPLLLLVFAYLYVHGCAVFYRCKYEKEL